MTLIIEKLFFYKNRRLMIKDIMLENEKGQIEIIKNVFLCRRIGVQCFCENGDFQNFNFIKFSRTEAL